MHPRALLTRWGMIALFQSAVLALSPLAAKAQDAFPSRNLELIIPYGAGSSTDAWGRTVADGLSRAAGQPVVATNHPGATGLIGVRVLQSAPADGYTLILLANSIIIDQVLTKRQDFDLRKDLVPVARALQAPMGIFVNNEVPVNSVSEFIAYLKEHPGELNYASSGIGSVAQLLTEQFLLATGTEMNHIPYPAGNAAISAAMMGGDIQVLFADIPGLAPFVKDGKMKYLATLNDQRSPIFPDAPAISEVGHPELVGVFKPFFFGFFAAADTDPAIVEKLAALAQATMQDPATRDRLVTLGYDAALLGGAGPDEFRQGILDEFQRVETIIRDAGITLQ